MTYLQFAPVVRRRALFGHFAGAASRSIVNAKSHSQAADNLPDDRLVAVALRLQRRFEGRAEVTARQLGDVRKVSLL